MATQTNSNVTKSLPPNTIVEVVDKFSVHDGPCSSDDDTPIRNNSSKDSSKNDDEDENDDENEAEQQAVELESNEDHNMPVVPPRSTQEDYLPSLFNDGDDDENGEGENGPCPSREALLVDEATKTTSKRREDDGFSSTASNFSQHIGQRKLEEWEAMEARLKAIWKKAERKNDDTSINSL